MHAHLTMNRKEIKCSALYVICFSDDCSYLEGRPYATESGARLPITRLQKTA